MRSHRQHGKHRTGKSVRRIRWRLTLERHLPPGVPPTEAALLEYFGVCP